MRIFHILGYLAQRYGGPPRVALSLGKAQERLGMTVSWWGTATEVEQRELAKYGQQIHPFPARFPRFWFFSPHLRSALEHHIQDVDILHLHQVWDYPLLAAARLAQKYDKPYLVTPHGIFSQSWRYNSLKKRLYLRFLARPLLNRSACIHAITIAELPGVRQVGLTAPVTVIPNGVELNQFSSLPNSAEAEHIWPVLKGRKVVLFLGRLSPEKGLDMLIEAWEDIHRRDTSALLMLAGPDHKGYRKELESLIRRHDLQDSVFLPGMLDQSLKLHALSRADLYVQPSYTEGFSVAILEALAAGKPCIITENCNFPQVAENNAGLVVGGNAEAIVQALQTMLSMSAEARKEMGKRGRLLVADNYTWDVIARKMLTVYQNILEEKPIPLHPEPWNGVQAGAEKA